MDDDRFLVDTLTEFLRTPAEAPLGQNFIDPRDPHVALFVRRVIEPRVEALGLKDLLHDDDNNLVFTVGDGAGATLLLMGYSSSHHGNRMEDPYSGRIEDASRYGVNELCAFGRGAGKKGSLAAALAALKIVVESGAKLRGRLVFAVNTEGYSSHRGSQRIFDGLDRLGFKPDTALLCVGTGLRACLGNRGRVDVLVTVRGRETHSSQPAAGLNAIDGAYDVLARLRTMRYEKSDPRLGREQITPYKLVIGPVAPHTIPEIAEFRLDRRLLPGSRVDNAVAEIRALLADLGQFGVEVAEGPFMLPFVTAPDAPLIQSLGRASRACRGTALETFYASYTGDAGYAASVGVPPVEFGPSASNETEKPTGTEFVPISQVKTAAQIYAYVIKDILR